ncbi:glucose 1-dehydrogenase [Novosphingobium sp.]|uniref:SDR family NAD(P)-dependent oxidoreductase n=1 Tax=Novosphingobium sp. TaxID=1874826 RepID=UPI00286EA283|nr:glucose 1-dehydrogenase [Novosphingobium sp.]
MFKDKVVLVTGAGSGIGAVLAQAFGAAGAVVAVCDVSAGAAQGIAADIAERGGTAAPFALDVRDGTAVGAMIDALVSTHGRLDVAVNNAGVGGSGVPLAEIAEEAFDRVVGVNLKGVWQCMRHEITAMMRSGGGVIINNASALGLIGKANSSDYVATKHAVIGLTKSAALEYSAQGIRVNAVCPGVIDTPLIQSRAGQPGFLDGLTALHPIGRLGQAHEVAEAIMWLASPQASFVTGIALPVDGGWTAA